MRSKLLAVALFFSSSPLFAQSLKIDEPAALHAGSNQATIDSFGGNQFWVLTVGPGAFKVTFHYGNRQEGFNTGGAPHMFVGFKPKVEGTTLAKPVDFPGGTTWTGTAAKASRLEVAVTPPPGSLVRQTTAYTIEASGAVSFGAAPGAAPSVVGVYAVKSGTVDHGVAKFAADGTVTSTNGEQGQWKLFDAESKIYTVTLGRDRWSLIYQPGRGFIDAQTQILVMEQRH